MFWMAIVTTILFLVSLWVAIFYKGENQFDESEVRRLGKRAGIVLVLLTVLFWTISTLTVIPVGHVGVQVILGKVKKEILPEGIHTKNPLVSIKKMSIQTQSYTMSKTTEEEETHKPGTISALTKDNLPVEMDITVLYKLVPSAAPQVYRILGDTKAYTEKIVKPSIRTAIRNSIANYTASEVMSEKRKEIEKNIEEELQKIIAGYFKKRGVEQGIVVERVLLRNVNPPEKIKEAIQAKLEAEQEAQKMAFVLQKEEMEAKRKAVEANGIANAQKIIARSLTPEYLQWYYIQALTKLINSPNNTTIILPFDQKLTPLLQTK